jgi:subtilisin family serine protease
MTSIVGSNNSECHGLAPEAELFILKVCYTEWFLEAFNFAMQNDVDIINLSNGRADFEDEPFIEKIRELIRRGIIIVAAIGNEWPEYGTLSNPGDLIEVIGVGSLNEDKTDVASISSRGMRIQNFLDGVGVIKPDIITIGENIAGFDHQGNCIVRSGTSVSSSIVTGTIAAVLSGFEWRSEEWLRSPSM